MIKVMGRTLSKDLVIMIVLIILYGVGISGFCLFDLRDILLPISGTILYITTIGVVLSSKSIFNNLLFLSIAFGVGFSAELIGVQTGVLFGDYSYGANLGFKLLGVPIVIGLLWGVLAVSCASCVCQFKPFRRYPVLPSAILMLGMDYIMEPVAISCGFWTWNADVVPIWNYICWFAIALLLQLIIKRGGFLESNKVFNLVFILMALFFSLLNLCS